MNREGGHRHGDSATKLTEWAKGQELDLASRRCSMDLVGFPGRKGSPEGVEFAVSEGEIDRLGREGLCR